MTGRLDWRGWLALTRASNLPTVWSNVLAGAGIGHVIGRTPSPPGHPFTLPIVGVLIGTSLLYLAGMMLNDVCDYRVDRFERPDRPLPSGRVDRRSAAVATIIAMAAGIGASIAAGWRAAVLAMALAGAIAAYDLLHKRHAWAAALMGLCRGLVYLMAVTAAVVAAPRGAPAVTAGIIVASIMATYTLLITLSARGEASPDRPQPRRWPGVAMLLVPPALAAAVAFHAIERPPGLTLLAIVALAAAVLWLGRSLLLLRRRPPRVGPAVEGCLAGFCLIDAMLLAWLGLPALAAAAAGLFVLTHLAHHRIRGT